MCKPLYYLCSAGVSIAESTKTCHQRKQAGQGQCVPQMTSLLCVCVCVCVWAAGDGTKTGRSDTADRIG